MLETLYDLVIGDYRALLGVVLSAGVAYALTLLGLRLEGGLALVVGAGATLVFATHARAGA